MKEKEKKKRYTMDYEKNSKLLTMAEVGGILKVSRQRVFQLVEDSRLVPDYRFGKSKVEDGDEPKSSRKFYLFEPDNVARYKKMQDDGIIPPRNSKVKPKEGNLLLLTDIPELYGCPPQWAYTACRTGLLEPELVVGDGRLIYLFGKKDVEKALAKRFTKPGPNSGHRKNTIKRLDKIRNLVEKGKSDREIAEVIGSYTSRVCMLRKLNSIKGVYKQGKGKSPAVSTTEKG